MMRKGKRYDRSTIGQHAKFVEAEYCRAWNVIHTFILHDRSAIWILSLNAFLQVIKKSRDVQKLSKQAIFSLHRGNEGEASQRLTKAREVATALLSTIEENPTLRPGSFSNACEEYTEAMIFSIYLSEGRVAAPKDIEILPGVGVTTEEYLGGLLDFTGELNRVAVAKATIRDVDAVKQARDVVEALQGQFLRLDLRNGAIRKKYDALKYTMKKLENTLYELSLINNGLISKPDDSVPEFNQEADLDAV